MSGPYGYHNNPNSQPNKAQFYQSHNAGKQNSALNPSVDPQGSFYPYNNGLSNQETQGPIVHPSSHQASNVNYGHKPNNQPEEFFPFQQAYQNVSPEVINTGLLVGQKVIQSEWDKRMTGVSSFWLKLKVYFEVNNSFVFNKILILLYPLSHQHWHRIPRDEQVSNSEYDMNTRIKFELPRHDNNAPDLYIPLMSFITYILLYGFMKGLSQGSKTFTPDILVNAIWRCLLIQVFEVFIMRFGFTMIGVSLPSLDIAAYTGYKYVSLCTNIVATLLGGVFRIFMVLYTSIMLGYFIVKTLAAAVPINSTTAGPTRHILIIAFAAIQCCLSVLFSWV